VFTPGLTVCPVLPVRAAICAVIVIVWHTLGGLTLAALAEQEQPSSRPPIAPSEPPTREWDVGAFVDGAYATSFNSPATHLFRNRGTTPRVDELVVNMAAAFVRKSVSDSSRWGVELTGQTGQDARAFGFSATAPNIGGAGWLTHVGAANVSYLAPVGGGLTVQAGIFGSLIGYDSLYAKDNFSYSRPWGADYTPYLMLGMNTSCPFSEKVTGRFAVVNGYWHLAHANDVPSIAGQIAVKGTDRITVKQTILYGPHQSNTDLEFWRVLSDSLVERKGDQFTAAFEYQLGAETVNTAGRPHAVWMAAQLPLHWTVRRPWSITIRPEMAWDRDGRWIGAPQSVKAFTTSLEYRVPSQRTETIVRVEHRVDDSRGAGGGFFRSVDDVTNPNPLTPTQNLLTLAVILAFDASARE
jgi:hypothetical protein